MKRSIFAYYVFSFFSGLHFFSAVLVPMLTVWGGLSFAQALLLQSIFTGSVFLFEVPTGVVADRLGRKTSVLIGELLCALGFYLYTLWPNFWIFATAETLLALAMSFISGADSALIYECLPEEGKAKEKQAHKIYAHANVFHMVGIMIASIAGSFIAANFGLIAPMKASILSVILATLAILAIPENRQTSKENRLAEPWWETAVAGIKQLKINQPLRSLSLSIMLLMSSGYFVIWLYQPLMSHIGFTVESFGLVHSLLVIAQIVVSLIHSRIPRRIKRFTPLLIFSGFLLASVWPSTASLLLLICFSGGLGLTSLKLNTARLNTLIDQNGNGHRRATILSTISMFRSGSTAFLNPIVGLAGDKSIRLALALVGTIPFAVFFLFRKTDQD